MDDVLSNAPVQYGALGLLIFILSVAISFIWRQWMKERKEWRKELADEREARDEERQQYHQELLGLNDRLISSQKELQLLLKSLTDGLQVDKLLREYTKKD
jgi:hypothetical protein